MPISSNKCSGEFFDKNQLIQDLKNFQLTADTLNAEEHCMSEDYMRGISAVIERLKLRKGDLILERGEVK